MSESETSYHVHSSQLAEHFAGTDLRVSDLSIRHGGRVFCLEPWTCQGVTQWSATCAMPEPFTGIAAGCALTPQAAIDACIADITTRAAEQSTAARARAAR